MRSVIAIPHTPVVAVVPQVRLHQTDVLCTVIIVVTDTKVSMMGIRITLTSSKIVAYGAVGRVLPTVSRFV